MGLNIKRILFIVLVLSLSIYSVFFAEDTKGSSNKKHKSVIKVASDVDEKETEKPIKKPIKKIDYEKYKVNEQGHILVVMYHGILDNPPYHRTKEQFKKDLQTMYDLGYRLISFQDYISGRISVEAGKTPIHLTFDDGLPSTFSLKKTANGFDVDKNTAIGILEEFKKNHPDFGKGASLYFHDKKTNFGDVGTDKDRFDWLLNHGYELGNHTATHNNLGKLSKEAVVKEIGRVEKYYESIYPNKKLCTLTYPFGVRPNRDYRSSALNGEYEGVTYSYPVGFREGPSGPFVPITHKDFQKFNAPRVRGSEGEKADLYWYFTYYKNNPSLKYVSDGNPDTIVIKKGSNNNLNDYAKDNFQVIEY